MAEVTVRQFAEVVGIPVDRLLAQLEQAGSPIRSADQPITDQEKMRLLQHLRRAHGEGEAAAEPKKITLKRRTVGELRQTGPRGKAKTVSVEVRKRRTYVKRALAVAEEAAKVEQQIAERARLEEAERARQEELRARIAEEERRRAEEEARRKAEEEARRRAEEAARRAAEEAARAAAAAAAAPVPERERKEKERERRREVEREEKATRYGRRELHLAGEKAGRRKKAKARPARITRTGGEHGFERPTQPIVREVVVPETITVGELAQRMSVKAAEVIKTLMKMGVMATINQTLDQDTAVLVVEEMGHVAKPQREDDYEALVAEVMQKAEGEALPRPPVVTVMGHVDHGKTSLLDYIRRSRVAAGEAGGITQHIGAYHVHTDKGDITFLDTPGHEAFTAMRARGAKVTDIVILVVAADDGVMPQTVEAIQHAKAAGVPLVVAVNKIDKPDADPDRVRNELAQHEVIPEDWGGDTIFVNVSAKTGQGVDELLEAVLLQAEVMELKAVRDAPAVGVVIESALDKGRGPVATILVQQGTLHEGDVLLAGQEYGRVRAMFDDAGRPVKEAGPSMPVLVLGLSGTPEAGDTAVVLEDERKAREIAEHRRRKRREQQAAEQATTLQDIFDQLKQGETHTLNVVLKADVQGSLEALKDALGKLSTEEVQVKLVGAGVGAITESDVNLALASNAVLIGFNVRADAAARRLAEARGVELRYYSVIYEVIDDLKKTLSGMLAPEIKERIVGVAEVREVFRSPKFGAVAGCLVKEGVVKRNNPIRVLRDNVVIFEGRLESLRRYKEDVNEVRAGMECGIAVKDYNDVRPGDLIEVYERVEVAREL
ncbi:MAG: translation initiation factor IF-2 [Gammaproteobacteria bacterium]|nr:MAG: translation initiation factor IF-2 [Gammaproteobacteria bacterium]